jgi:hypothetical protein
MIGITSNKIFGLGIRPYEALAATYIAAIEDAGATPTSGEVVAITSLAKSLSEIGLSKFSAVYPFLGGLAASHAIDLMGNYPIAWSGSVTHNANGILGDGSTGYGMTGIIPSTDENMLINSSHLSAYHNQNPAVGQGTTIGCHDGTRYLYHSATRLVDQIDYYYVNTAVGNFASPAAGNPPDGFFVVNREISTHQDLYQNGTRTSNHAATSTGLPTKEIYILAQNSNGSAFAYAIDQLGFASVGSGLTSAEITTFNTAVEDYQTALSRNI